jgi:hypothetical protein
MRILILILIIVVVAILLAVGSGFLNINQVRPARVPQVSTTNNGVVAKGGQAPAFDVETGSVKVGTRESTVKVPSVEVVRPGTGNEAANAVANAQ